MEVATITAAYNGLKFAKETFTFLLETKIEVDARQKILDSLRQVGEAQDQLFQFREELYRLQTENRELKESILNVEDWKSRKMAYDLVETEGGAVVYQSKGTPKHYACPSCIERKEIQILQDRRVLSGDFDCPGCGKHFPVKPMEQVFDE